MLEQNKKDSINTKIDNKIDLVFLSDDSDNQKYKSILFPIYYDNYRHKYLIRYDFCLRNEIIYPMNFTNIFYPEFIDKLMNIEILILSYNIQNVLSLENIKTFYYLYYSKLEERDRPKNIIILEFDYRPNENINYIGGNNIINNTEQLANLFKGYFCKYEENEEKLKSILNKCLINLEKDQLFNDYSLFSILKSNEDINFNISLFGNDDLQNYFIKLLLLESNYNFNYKKLKDGLYSIKCEKNSGEDNTKLNFKINLFKRENYYKSEFFTECNILLYSVNNENKSFDNIKDFIFDFLLFQDEGKKQLFYLFALNNNSDKIIDSKNKIGKNIAEEIGAFFSVINANNNSGEEIQIQFDNILEEIIKCINDSKIIIKKQINNNIKVEECKQNFDFFELKNYSSPYLYMEEINNKIKNNFCGNYNFLLNLCENCYDNLNIRINNSSNIIITYCQNCKFEPKGLKIEEFLKKKHDKINKFICQKCFCVKNYKFNKKILSCNCESLIKSSKNFKQQIKDIFKKTEIEEEQDVGIPLFLKDSYCDKHKKFHSYYLKYSKIGLCEDDYNSKKKNNYFTENINERNINDLINQKKKELQNELEFIKLLRSKVKEWIKSLKAKLDSLILKKIELNNIKGELINSLQVIKNNYTIFENVNSLKFDLGEKFCINEKDTIENKLKYLYNYLNYESDIYHMNFNKNIENVKKNYNSSYINIQSKYNSEITDVWGLNNNKLVCVSFDNGQAKIFHLNVGEKNNYPICTIEEFSPNYGIYSLYVSKSDFWKINNDNKNDIIYLNGYEQIKIIQMNDNYKTYNLLYNIIEENSKLIFSAEINYSTIITLSLKECNYKIKIISLNKEANNNNEIKKEIKDITEQIIESGQSPLNLNMLTENIISLNITKESNLPLLIFDEERFTLKDESDQQKKPDIKRKDVIKFNSSKNSIISRINKQGPNTGAQSFRNDIENFNKIIYLNLDKIKDIYNNNFIQKEFSFEKGFEVLGSLSKEENLLLINYINNTSSFTSKLYIFDFNICQFTYSFIFHALFTLPKIYLKINFKYSLEKIQFILCDDELNLFQYYYSKDYSNKIYYQKRITPEKKVQSGILKILNLESQLMVVCKNSDYYILNN